MQENAQDVELLVLGSSHTFYGIRPHIFDGKAFSLANVSQGIKQDLFLLKYWADKYERLSTVIFPISASTWFGRGLEYGSESYRCRYYKIYMDCDLYPDISSHNLELSNYRTAKGKIKKIFKNSIDPGHDEHGWGNAYMLFGKDIEKWKDGTEAETAVKRHTAKNWDYVEDNYSQLKDLADFCKSRNIQLVLITTPCWHSYYDKLNKEQLTKMSELTYKFQQEYNIPYFNYLRDSRFEADDFYDSNHLSDVGAIKFTEILAKDINVYLRHEQQKEGR